MRFLVLLLLMLPVLVTGEPIVIAHRGASGYLPEHTLAAYEKAIDLGADYIEPDLVLTRDGYLIARHEHYLSATTDIAVHPEFARRKRTMGDRTDWFSEDFTLAEIGTLRARQAFPGRTTDHDGQYGIPTLQEVIDLVKRKEKQLGRDIGIYPEAKSPDHFRSLGFDFAGTLMATLAVNDLDRPDASVFIQSFEPGILAQLNEMTELPLVMLLTPASRREPHVPNIDLEEVAKFADGIGPMKILLLDRNGNPTGVVARAHELGMFVHAWTFRNDAWPEDDFESPQDEIRRYLEIGIDGFFTDFPDTGVAVRDRFSAN